MSVISTMWIVEMINAPILALDVRHRGFSEHLGLFYGDLLLRRDFCFFQDLSVIPVVLAEFR